MIAAQHAATADAQRAAHAAARRRAEPLLAVIRQFLYEDLPRERAAFEADAPHAMTPDGPSHDLVHSPAYMGLMYQAEGMRALLRGIEPDRAT